MAATARFLPSELHQHRKERSSPSLGSLEAQQATFPIPVPHHLTIPPSLGMSCALYQEHCPVHPSGISHLRGALLDDSGYREAPLRPSGLPPALTFTGMRGPLSVCPVMAS